MDNVARGDPGYPARLECLADAPLRVWIAGRLSEGEAVALVGARGADMAGRRFAFELAFALAKSGLTIVSGGARGIDGEAHRGALAAGGRTIAVLGSGVDVPYPPEHEQLLAEIASKGALLSEQPPGRGPRREAFPKRNRLIAALSDACVIVQADERSGSLSTARAADRIGRPVLAVPWDPQSPLGRGTAELLRRGARVATGAPDVLNALGMEGSAIMAREDIPLAQNGAERDLLGKIPARGATVDDLVVASGLSCPEVSRVLLTLELQGLVVRSDCGRIERTG